MLWIFENGTGLRVSASPEDAAEMVKEGGTHSCLNPRGTAEQEEAEFKKLMAAHEATVRQPDPEPEQSEEVHHRRGRAAREQQ